MIGKRPGKICRTGKERPAENRPATGVEKFLYRFQWLTGSGRLARDSQTLNPKSSLGSNMTRTFATAFAAVSVAIWVLVCAAAPAGATSRIKDLANIEGVRQNQLIGYGLVVGLNGTGDTLNNIPFTKQSLQAMLERLGVNIRGATIRTGNVAAVMVTSNLPPFGTQGTRIDVTVSALGDSKSLQGGTLLVTPLLGADGNVYAVAQGSVAISGFQAEGEAAKIVRGVPTVGRITNGAIIEREIEFALNKLNQVRLALRNADFTTAKRIAAAINDYIGAPIAEPLDPSTVQITLPPKPTNNVVAMLTEIEQLQVDPDLAAKVVVDERSGIIVMGRDVRVATVAVAQGNLTVTISETPQVSQPQPFARGQTVVTPRTRVGVSEDGKRLAVVKEGVSLQQLVDGLNALGIGPRDLIAILQAIKAAGAIQADLEVM
jgi:flagellar P-ring protein precursor FlgI